MPTLSRIRIVNVTYDHKYITDELFNLYGDANTLFNLANGSGKSVLVQMILQPILPCKRLHDRKVESYLTKGGAPTCILLEWKLDRTARPSYVTTGIVLGFNRETDNSAFTSAKYFTFVHHYTVGNEMDIEHIPLTTREDNGAATGLSYEKTRSLLQEKEQSALDLRYYAKDRRQNYETALQEYGIFPVEWETLARINEKEGGVDELFAKCKSSDALLDSWILPAISQVASPERSSLTEMFETLIESILQNEKTLQNKDSLESFLQRLTPFVQETHALCATLEQKERVEGQLIGLFHYLGSQWNAHADAIERQKEKASSIQNELRHIHGEELSKDFYDKEESLEICRDCQEDIQIIAQEKKEQAERAEHEYQLWQAAELYEDYRQAAQQMALLDEQIQHLRQGEDREYLNNVIFSLAVQYEKEIDDCNSTKENAKFMEDKCKNDLEQMTSRNKENLDEDRAFVKRMAELEEKQSVFTKCEEELFGDLNIQLSRNMLSELDKRELAVLGDAFAHEAVALEHEIAELSARMESIDRQTEKIRQRRKASEGGQWNMRLRLAQAEQDIQTWQTETDNLRAALQEYMSDVDVYHKAENLTALRRQQESSRVEEQTARQLQNQLGLKLENLEKGKMHTSTAFSGALQSAGITSMTGDEYLRNIDDPAFQQRLLQVNPLLPYCFLVSRGDLEAAQEVSHDLYIDRVCPILAIDDVEKPLRAQGRTLITDSALRLVSRYDWESIDADTRKDYADKLTQELADINSLCHTLQCRLEKMGQVIRLAEQYPYEPQEVAALENRRAEIKNQIAAVGNQIQQLEQEEAQQGEQKKALESRQQQCALSIPHAQSRRDRFEAYRENNALFESRVTEIDKLQQKIHSLTKERQRLEEEIDFTREEIHRQGKIADGAENTGRNLYKKRSDLTIPACGQLLPYGTEVLEERYQALRFKLGQDEQRLVQEKDSAAKSQSDKKKSLEKRFSHLPREEYETIRFDEDQLEHLRLVQVQLKSAYDEAKETFIRKEMETKSAKARFEECRQELNKNGFQQPLDRSRVRGNFEARRKICQEQMREIEDSQKQLKMEQSKLETVRHEILGSGVDVSLIPETAPKDGYQSLDCRQLKVEYKYLSEEAQCGQNRWAVESNNLGQDFKNQLPAIDNVLKNIQTSQIGVSFSDCYHVYERLTDMSHLLQNSLDILKNELKRLETHQEHVVRHATEQGQRLHRELGRINSNASIALGKDRVSTPLLHLGIPALDNHQEERVRNHVAQCILTAREEFSTGDLQKDKLYEYIRRCFSDRQLLNVTINQTHIPIKVYKVEAIAKNSHLKKWEQVVVENSGGELFVSCFILVSALMSYKRKRKLEQQNADEGKKVFLIDNPFGKASSPHLLEAILQVSKKFRTQLICLSDLSQGSITRQFDLIYQLVLRKATYSARSYMKVEDIKKKDSIISDSRLEHIAVRWENEQLSL